LKCVRNLDAAMASVSSPARRYSKMGGSVIFNLLPEDRAIVAGFLAFIRVSVKKARRVTGVHGAHQSAANIAWVDQMAALAAQERAWQFKVQV
jgi:hypothetical protein